MGDRGPLDTSLDRARELSLSAWRIYHPRARWNEIAESSEAIFKSKAPHQPLAERFFEILVGVVEYPKMSAVVCGTLVEIAKSHPSPMRLALVSVSRCAAVLRTRAAQLDIDLGDFWQGGRGPWLSRTEHCALAGIELGAFKAMVSRGQVHSVPGPHYEPRSDEDKRGRGYLASAVLGLIIADAFATGGPCGLPTLEDRLRSKERYK